MTPPSKHWLKIAEEFDAAFAPFNAAYPDGTLRSRAEIKEFYRKRFEKQEEALRIANEALERISKTKIHQLQTLEDGSVKVSYITETTWDSEIAEEALSRIHSLQSDE